jgi:hypothetical protein
MDPITIGLWVELAKKAYEVADGLVARLKAAGVQDSQLADITLDYDARLARRQAEASPG